MSVEYYGPLRTFLFMLQQAPSMQNQNVSILYGEEFIAAQDAAYPIVVIVPIGGPVSMPGYYDNANPNTNNQWVITETVDFYIAAESRVSSAEPVDHADEVYALRRNLLRALQYQQPRGWYYREMRGRWELDQNAINRRGRAYILSVDIEMTVADAEPVTVTVEDASITVEIES